MGNKSQMGLKKKIKKQVAYTENNKKRSSNEKVSEGRGKVGNSRKKCLNNYILQYSRSCGTHDKLFEVHMNAFLCFSVQEQTTWLCLYSIM